MSKKVVKIIKLQIPAGKANPAPPIGPALGAAGVNIMAFCKAFNAQTQGMGNKVLPTVITVYHDKTISFITKEPPVANQIKDAAGVAKGSGVPNRDKVGKITLAQARAIAENKLQDMNAADLDMATNIVCGTARSMGIDVIKE
ncbi:MAG: 50S ribosomal protein L11 [Parachlamydia sp.]|jgi:large subunit ribosomal protein L11|nr:50S ribosomal protein L11 [Parachlamydia sp.]